MTKEEIIKKAYKVYPERLVRYFDRNIDANKELREGYIKGCTDQLESSLPNNLDEAAEKYNESESWRWEAPMYPHREAFKAGAKWMAGQGVEGYVIESSNPVVEEGQKPQHLITLLYEDTDDNYVVGGDRVIVQIRKK